MICDERLSDGENFLSNDEGTDDSIETFREIPLRKGKWSIEEELYTERLVELFKAGLLNLKYGVSLRIFLAERLNCEPMRITKKFSRDKSIGKQIYHPNETIENYRAVVAQEADRLRVLETMFYRKVEKESKDPLKKRDLNRQDPYGYSKKRKFMTHRSSSISGANILLDFISSVERNEQ